ncbi:MAG: hypothetical protein HFI86_05295 [Bacilli bacterium]|nr:hypothetical protein [Bacilli bacterium]MCI9434664.1 hypothetical protein [Bacilli bacterium]
MNAIMFIVIALIISFIVIYRRNVGNNVYKFITKNIGLIYDKFAPYSFKIIREKVKELGQDYTPRQYAIQITVFAIFGFIISYMYFYSIVISVIYALIAISVIPYITYLRCKRIYSEFIFEQIQVYTTNTIMEFAVTQSFVKSLEGVVQSGVLEDPVKSDVELMINMAYENGTIDQALEYMNEKYDYYIVKNMHQLFLQITNEGSKDSGEALENMSLDVDMLVENVYRDRMDRAQFHKKFLQFGVILYLLVMMVQFMLGVSSYIKLLDNWMVQVLLHLIIIINSFFLLNGEKYYNQNVGGE